MKRKRHEEKSLASIVLRKKLKTLASRSIHVEQADTKTSFDFLLDVCLALIGTDTREDRCKRSSSRQESEEAGDYDLIGLQDEDLESATEHCQFVGPIKCAPLPGIKKQGVVATRDILKGELLCTSIPSIVTRNLSSRSDPDSDLFSDLSRAEMTAQLITLAQNPVVRKKLHAFEWAGKEKHEDDIRMTCEELVLKYTWAIDHPANNPLGRPLFDTHTKVAGHAFTIDGFASKFNHSCVPNATMITYGAIQFFRANCSIARGSEVCVSYGYDPQDDVEQRRKKLWAHAEFTCTCPLCLWEETHAKHSKQDLHLRRSHKSVPDTENPIEQCAFLLSVLPTFQCHILRIESESTSPHAQTKALLKLTDRLLDDDPEVLKQLDVHDTHLVTILWTLNRFSALMSHVDSTSQPFPPESLTHTIDITALYLSLMFLSLAVDRPPDVGVQHGDMFRGRMQALGKLLMLDDWTNRDGDKSELHCNGEYWHERSLEYTDAF